VFFHKIEQQIFNKRRELLYITDIDL